MTAVTNQVPGRVLKHTHGRSQKAKQINHQLRLINARPGPGQRVAAHWQGL